MQKTKLEIIDETVAAYRTNKDRARQYSLGSGRTVCKYITDDGKKCAVGRCMAKPLDVEGGVRMLAYMYYQKSGVSCKHLDDLLKPEYRGHELGFWVYLQSLHDTEGYHDENGWTDRGKEAIEFVKKIYAKNKT